MVEQPGGKLRHTGARPSALHWLALGVLGSAFFVVLLDATIAYVALPRIERDLRFAPGDLHWVMTTYLLAFGGLLLLGGRLAEAVGWRRMFLVGAAVFVVGSALSGVAWSGTSLLAGRAVQGIGAALVAPTTLPLLLRAFDDGHGRRKVLLVWTAIGALTGTTGFIAGGLLTDAFGWRSVFLVNLPVGVFLLAVAPVVLQVHDRGQGRTARRRIDVAGAVTLIATLVLVATAIAGIGRMHWALTAGLFAGAALALAAFAVIEAHTPEPLLPLYLLRSRVRGGGILVLLAAGIAVDGTSLLATLFLQGERGYSGTMFGLVLSVMTIASVIGSFAGQALAARGGLTLVAATGTALIGVGLVVFSAALVDGRAGDVWLGLLALGFGIGAAFVSGQIAVVAGADPAHSLPASGLADTAFSVGGAIGLATVSTVLLHGQLGLDGYSPAASYQPAFLAAAGLTAIGLAATLLLRVRRAKPAGAAVLPPAHAVDPIRPAAVGLVAATADGAAE